MDNSHGGRRQLPLACALGRSDEPRNDADRPASSRWPDPKTSQLASDNRTPEAIAKANSVYDHPSFRAAWPDICEQCCVRLGFSFNPARPNEESVIVSASTWDGVYDKAILTIATARIKGAIWTTPKR